MKGVSLLIFSALMLGSVALLTSGCQKKRPPRLAIIGFVDEQGRPQAQPDLMALLTALLTTNELELVERSELDRVLREQSMSLSGLVPLKDATAVGKLLRADWVLIGNAFKDDDAKSLLAKVVDARRGIILNFGIFKLESSDWTPLAGPIADLVQSTRNPAAAKGQPIFIAVGAFEDVGIDNRYADFGSNLRRKLSTTYQPGQAIVLERETVGPLVDELRMSQMGLSVDEQPSVPAQQARLLVSGVYQAYRDERSKLNLVVRIERLGQDVQTFAVNEPVGESLDLKIVGAIETALKQPLGRMPAASEEVSNLVEFAWSHLHLGKANDWLEPEYVVQIPNERVRRERDRPEAIKALLSALLLDPNNPEVKYALGAGMLTPEVKRREEGIGYLLEVIAGSTNQFFVNRSRELLATTHTTKDPMQAMTMFETLRQNETDIGQKVRYGRTLQDLYQRLYREGRLSLEERLDRQVELMRLALLANKSKPGPRPYATLASSLSEQLGAVSRVFMDNPKGLIQFLDDLFPRLQAQWPEATPYVVCGYVNVLGTNLPPVWKQRYLELLARLKSEPEGVLSPRDFYDSLRSQSLWSHRYFRDEELTGLVLEILHTSGAKYLSQDEVDNVEFLLGWRYRQAGQFDKARDSFQQIGDRSLMIHETGPWGNRGRFNGALLAAECERLLAGKQSEPVPGSSLGEPILRLKGWCRIASDGPTLWLIYQNRLWTFDKETRELHSVKEAGDHLHAYAIAGGRETIWIGTQGQGLFAVNKHTKKVRNLTTEQGLLRPDIRLIYEGSDKLWIGFGKADPLSLGGIGYWDLQTDAFVGVMGELKPEAANLDPTQRRTSNLTAPGQLPQGLVTDFNQSASNELLVALRSSMYWLNIEQKKLTVLTNGVICAAANESFIVGGGLKGLHVRDRNTGSWRFLNEAHGLPATDILGVVLDGDRAYLSSSRQVTRVNLSTGRAERIYQLTWPGRVYQLDLEGDELWVLGQTEEPEAARIYRIDLND